MIPKKKFIGHIATSEGLCVDPSKVAAIVEMPVPTNTAGVQRLLERCLLFCGTERNGTPDSAKYLFCGTHRNGPKTASQLSGYCIEMYPRQVALIS